MNRSELFVACFGRDDFRPCDRVVEVCCDGHLVAHAGYYDWDLRVESQRPSGIVVVHARVAAVAQVCVDPAFRGRGLARAVVRALHMVAVQHGHVFAALWSDYERLYGPLGYDNPDPRHPSLLVAEIGHPWVPWPDGDVEPGGQW